MIGFALQTTVDGPPEDVFRFLLDFEHLPTWYPDVERMEQLTTGQLRVGSELCEVRRVPSPDRVPSPSISMRMTVVAFEPDAKFAVTGRVAGVRVTSAWELAPSDIDEGGTELLLCCDVEPARAVLLPAVLPGVVAARVLLDWQGRRQLGAVGEGYARWRDRELELGAATL